MEQAAALSVSKPPRLKGGGSRPKRDNLALAERVRLANLIRPVISRMSTEAVRKAIGDSEDNVPTTQRDCGKIKSTRPERIHGISLDRLYVFIEGLQIDPSSQPAGLVH